MNDRRAEALENWIRELTLHLRAATGEQLGLRMELRKPIGEVMLQAQSCISKLRSCKVTIDGCSPEYATHQAERADLLKITDAELDQLRFALADRLVDQLRLDFDPHVYLELMRTLGTRERQNAWAASRGSCVRAC